MTRATPSSVPAVPSAKIDLSAVEAIAQAVRSALPEEGDETAPEIDAAELLESALKELGADGSRDFVRLAKVAAFGPSRGRLGGDRDDFASAWDQLENKADADVAVFLARRLKASGYHMYELFNKTGDPAARASLMAAVRDRAAAVGPQTSVQEANVFYSTLTKGEQAASPAVRGIEDEMIRRVGEFSAPSVVALRAADAAYCAKELSREKLEAAIDLAAASVATGDLRRDILELRERLGNHSDAWQPCRVSRFVRHHDFGPRFGADCVRALLDGSVGAEEVVASHFRTTLGAGDAELSVRLAEKFVAARRSLSDLADAHKNCWAGQEGAKKVFEDAVRRRTSAALEAARAGAAFPIGLQSLAALGAAGLLSCVDDLRGCAQAAFQDAGDVDFLASCRVEALSRVVQELATEKAKAKLAAGLRTPAALAAMMTGPEWMRAGMVAFHAFQDGLEAAAADAASTAEDLAAWLAAGTSLVHARESDFEDSFRKLLAAVTARRDWSCADMELIFDAVTRQTEARRKSGRERGEWIVPAEKLEQAFAALAPSAAAAMGDVEELARLAGSLPVRYPTAPALRDRLDEVLRAQASGLPTAELAALVRHDGGGIPPPEFIDDRRSQAALALLKERAADMPLEEIFVLLESPDAVSELREALRDACLDKIAAAPTREAMLRFTAGFGDAAAPYGLNGSVVAGASLLRALRACADAGILESLFPDFGKLSLRSDFWIYVAKTGRTTREAVFAHLPEGASQDFRADLEKEFVVQRVCAQVRAALPKE